MERPFKAAFQGCHAGIRAGIFGYFLFFLPSLAIRLDPLTLVPSDGVSADRRFTKFRPSRLAHQSASCLSFLNVGMVIRIFILCFPSSVSAFRQSRLDFTALRQDHGEQPACVGFVSMVKKKRQP